MVPLPMGLRLQHACDPSPGTSRAVLPRRHPGRWQHLKAAVVPGGPASEDTAPAAAPAKQGWRLPFPFGRPEQPLTDEYETDSYTTDSFEADAAASGQAQVPAMATSAAAEASAVQQDARGDAAASSSQQPAAQQLSPLAPNRGAAWLRDQLADVREVSAMASWSQPLLQHAPTPARNAAPPTAHVQLPHGLPEGPPQPAAGAAAADGGAAAAGQTDAAAAQAQPAGSVPAELQLSCSGEPSTPWDGTALPPPPAAVTIPAAASSSSSRSLTYAAVAPAWPTAWQGASPPASAGGWILALLVLFAIKLSRQQSDLDRLDPRSLQHRQHESRVQSRELREKRRAFMEEERVRKEAEAARRVEEVQRKAEEADRNRAAGEAARREEQSRATAKVVEQLAAQRKVYEEQQGRMGEELARRTEAEVKLREERQQRQRDEEEARRREEAARVAAAAELQRLAQEAEQQRRADAATRAAEEARLLLELQTTYSFLFRGTATCTLLPVGAAASGSVKRSASSSGGGRSSSSSSASSSSSSSSSGPAAEGEDAPLSGRFRVQLSAQLDSSTSRSGSSGSSSDASHLLGYRAGPRSLAGGYETADAALEGASELAARLSEQLVEEVRAAAAADGSAAGPACRMDELDLLHWSRLSRVQVAVALRQAVVQVAALAGATPLEQPLQVLSRWVALPLEHLRRADAVLLRAIGHIESEDGGQAAQEVMAVIAEQERLVRETTPLVPPAVVATVVLSYLLDRAAALDSGGGGASVGSGALRDAALAFALRQLGEAARPAPLDALARSAWAASAALGPRHPLVRRLAELVEANQSPATRRALDARKQQEQLAVAAASLQGAARDRALPNSRGRAPVAEQLWATRNVANKMVAFAAPGQMSEGVALLEQAVQLAADAYGEGHPGQLSVLIDYRDALNAAGALAESEAEARELAGRCADVTVQILQLVQVVAERYVEQVEGLSAALLLESALRELGVTLPDGHPELAAVRARLQQLCDQLGPSQTRLVLSRSLPQRPPPDGSMLRPPPLLVRQVGRDFTEQLGVYSASRRSGNVFELWNKHLPLPPLR